MLHNHLRNFTSHELAIDLDAPDKTHHRADGVDELCRRVEIRGHKIGCLRDARHAVTLSEGGNVGSQQKGCEDELFLFRCHCHNLFSFFVPWGRIFPSAVDTFFILAASDKAGFWI